MESLEPAFSCHVAPIAAYSVLTIYKMLPSSKHDNVDDEWYEKILLIYGSYFLYKILLVDFKGFLIVMGFNDTSTLAGHFVSSRNEREKRDSRRDEREEQGRKRNKNESKETEEIKNIPPLLLPATRKQALLNCKPVSVGRPCDRILRGLDTLGRFFYPF